VLAVSDYLLHDVGCPGFAIVRCLVPAAVTLTVGVQGLFVPE